MSIFFSPSVKSFFHSEFSTDYPTDVIEISSDLYKSLHDGLCLGRTISLDANGTPELVPLPVPSEDDIKAGLRAYAANARYDHETAGIKMNGSAVATDRTSQNLINGAVVLLNNDSTRADISFKITSGSWVVIQRADMIAMGIAVGNYVQACFAAEQSIDALIESGSMTLTAQIDSFPWPSTSIDSATT